MFPSRQWGLGEEDEGNEGGVERRRGDDKSDAGVAILREHPCTFKIISFLGAGNRQSVHIVYSFIRNSNSACLVLYFNNPIRNRFSTHK